MRFSLITLAFATLIPVAASATTYDAVAGFSTANPSGPWTYGTYQEATTGAFTPVGGTFTPYTSPASTGYSGYTYFGSLPLVGHNTENLTSTSNTFYVPPTELWLHPGSGVGEDTAVEFTVPTSGYYNVLGSFTSRNDAVGEGNGVVAYILNDGAFAESQTLTGQNGSTFLITSSGPVHLDQGEVVLFGVNNNGAYNYDSTGFDVTFTTASTSVTPEPSSLVLLGTGVLGLAGAVRRRIRG